MPLGIYVHVPFCKSKCRYCDFNSSDKNFALEDLYVQKLGEEIKASPFCESADTAFIGGGTPTALKLKNLIGIVDAVSEKFGRKISEFTVECNPATIGECGFSELKKHGVNRISIGLQSADDGELAFLGRIHTFETFLKTYRAARKAGIENINIDLMFSLHNQTTKTWENTLKKVIELEPQHISCYSLIVEEGTPFYDMELNLPDEETDREMYYSAIELMEKSGYTQYEISNFAKPGFECRHNIKYWERKNYIGFGCGASSLYNDVRFENSYDIKKYINGNKVTKNPLSKDEAESEHIFLGLRLCEGFDILKFNRLYSTDFEEKYDNLLKKYKSLGLVETDGGRCRLTKKGFSVSNSVMCEFV